MTKREKLLEQYEDALFSLLMDEFAESEGKAALEENARLKADPILWCLKNCSSVAEERYRIILQREALSVWGIFLQG